MAREYVENKAKAFYKDFNKERIRLMYLENPHKFFQHIERYSSSMPFTPPILLLSVVCEGCGIRPFQPLSDNYAQAQKVLVDYLPYYRDKQKPLSINYDVLYLEHRTLIRNKQFLENADAIADFAAKFTRFIVGVRDAYIMNPNNHDLKKLKSACEEMFKEIEQTLKEVRKAQTKFQETQLKAEQVPGQVIHDKASGKQSARSKVAEEFLNHPINRDSSPLKSRNR